MSLSFHLLLSFNPGSYKLMTASNDSTVTVGTNEHVIAKVDARAIIDTKRKAGGGN